jgi:S-methylmethionine-dependent homocysteine/selenocysteine methylase
MQNLNLPDRPILLDGGLGRELRSRGVNVLTTIWSTNGLILAPDIVRQIHQDYIFAGATVVGGCCGNGPAHIAKSKELLS